jgi:hypothetical protein
MQTLMGLYSSSYLSAVDNDPTLQSMRFSALQAGAVHLLKANQSTPGFNQPVSVPEEVQDLVNAIFGPGPVTKGHLSILLQLGLVTPDAQGGYVLTTGGDLALGDSKVASSAGTPKFIPSLALLSLLSPTALEKLKQAPDKSAAIAEMYAALLKYNPTLIDAPAEKFSGGRLGNNAQKVLDKIFGTTTQPVGADKPSPYNATQVNLAVAAGLLKFDPKTGVFTATPAGEALLNPPAPPATDPASAPPDLLYSSLQTLLADLKNSKKDTRRFDTNKDGNITWDELNQIVNGISNAYNDD